ncbi:MAG: hypothetical protein DRP87_00510 [Spirochaetes bacterium]|nr:MAG: hypothetical protein DRP87_00510 [Spirochaetota bacterium]
MKTFKIQVEVKSPLLTPLHGDTLFGHLCWGIVRHEGEDALQEFFLKYKDVNTIPIILSNAFPEDTIPYPQLSPSMLKETDNIEEYKLRKKEKKYSCIPAELILNNNQKISRETIHNSVREKTIESYRACSRLRNKINRLSNTTFEDSVYPVEEIWYFERYKNGKSLPALLDIYALSNENENRIEELLEWAIETGYGADKSLGYGILNIKGIEEVFFPETGNRCMALGHFVPEKNENLKNLKADVFTKYGKLSGDKLLSSNPFKKPIVMYREGATFDFSGQQFVGTLLKDVHADNRIRHHAFAPLIRFTEEEKTS